MVAVDARRRTKIAFAASPVLLWGLFSGAFGAYVPRSGIAFWVYDAFVTVGLPLGCLWYIHSRLGVDSRDYGLKHYRTAYTTGEFLVGLSLCSVVFLSFLVVHGIAYRMFPPLPEMFTFHQNVPKQALLGFLVILYFSATAALGEEIFFRGVLRLVMLPVQPRRIHIVMYILGSALLFGLNHWGLGMHKVVATTYLGLIAALLYLKVDNLWFIVCGHFVINVIGFF